MKNKKLRSQWSHFQSQGKIFGHAQVRRKPAPLGDFPWGPARKEGRSVLGDGMEA